MASADTGGPREQEQHASGLPASDPNSYDKYENFLDRTTGERTHLVYENGQVSVYNANNKEIMRIPGTSGSPGVTDPTLKREGPIPPGTYWFWPDEISPSGIYRKFFPWAGDWGDYRVRLYPNKETDSYGRTNFFLHGGKKPGSAGCIDIGDADKHLFPWLEGLKGPIYVTVK